MSMVNDLDYEQLIARPVGPLSPRIASPFSGREAAPILPILFPVPTSDRRMRPWEAQTSMVKGLWPSRGGDPL